MKHSDSTDRPLRKCNCSGTCGPGLPSINRRQFLSWVGIGGAAALLPGAAWADFSLPSDKLKDWRNSFSLPSTPLRYLSDKHTDARMHLGGIGTGNIEIGADGQFGNWQLFNTLRDGYVPFYFIIKTATTAKLLQTAGGPDWSRVKQIEMTGEYPLAKLRFQDPDLPVHLELQAFTPFAPLDAAMSSVPLAAFLFKIHNPDNHPREVTLAALMQNPVGYDASSQNASLVDPCFGGNINHPLHENGLSGLVFRALPAADPTLDRPVTILTLGNLKDLSLPPTDRPSNLKVETVESGALPEEKISNPTQTVIWLEEAAAELAPELLRSARDAAKGGATLLFAGRSQPLLQAYAEWTQGKPVADVAIRADIVFEDFESGYENWQIDGEAFGKKPAQGTLSGQQHVSGFLGHGLVNTFLGGDDTVGRLVSKPFQIQRRFIRFLIGGGHYQETQMRLVVDGQIEHASSGKDNERLEPVVWDVSAWEGRTAHLEIVDARKGGWGHINVDQIEFTDLPGPRELLVLLEELLPTRFTSVHTVSEKGPAEFQNVTLRDGATKHVSEDGVTYWSRELERGKVVIAEGCLLEPARASISQARQKAFTFICALLGAGYKGSAGIHPKAPGFGTLALVTSSKMATVLPAFTDWDLVWKHFSSEGRFSSLSKARSSEPTPEGRSINGAVAASISVPPGGTVEVPFLLAWHYPNKYNASNEWMGCHYSAQTADVTEIVRAAERHFDSWRQKTEKFHSVFYDSSLPYWLIDCLTANAAIMRHIGIVFQIANGDVYGWEGSNGCCDPTCTHVWGYEQSFSRLFPELEKEMRRIDFKHQQRQDGGVNNRTEVPSPPQPTGEQPFADGHASCILKAYREALNHPNEELFKDYWPMVKRAVEYLIERDAKAGGGNPLGILQDDQWNTYDEALHGVTTFISGYYLAALRAGEEWARRLGEISTADRFREIFLKGQSKLVELCWNGEYFQQQLPDYDQRRGEVGPGCMSDQLIGQWWAHQLGLGYILPVEKVLSSLQSIFKYNFKSDLTNWKHAPRAFAGARDKGLIICTWPKGGRPEDVMLYSDEVWTGIEYQVAAHLIYEGLVEEGLCIVKAARERYDGIPRPPISRNPWNEIECGGHYARAMSSWSLLLALSGWHFDGPRGELRFHPRHNAHSFKSFFSGPEGWGSLSQNRDEMKQTNHLQLAEGRLALRNLSLQLTHPPATVDLKAAGRSLKHSFSFADGVLQVSLAKELALKAGQSLNIVSIGRKI